MRRVPGPLLALTALLALTGCPGEPPAKTAASPAPAPPSWKGPPPEPVVEACSRCHAFAPPDALPRARWAELLPTMLEMPGPEGAKPLSAEELKRASAYYAAASPLELPAVKPAPAVSTHAKRFVIQHHTPRGLEKRRIPATANVRFARLSDRPGQELLAAEMRARVVFLLSGKPKARMIPLQANLNYPCHVEPADIDNDGKLDLLVASLGDMNPTNAQKGSIHLLLRRGKRFEKHDVATGLGRVADLQAADLDGDDDLDLIAAVFGWRGPGKLLVYERTGELSFAPRELDPRDGWIHVAPHDLDGDGDLDLVALLSQEHEQVVCFVNQGKLRFTPQVLHRAPHPAWGYSGMQLVDLDRDGDQDVLVSNGDALDDDLLKPYHGVSWLENQSAGKTLKFVHHRIADDLPGCERAVAGDLDGDGDLDVVTVSFLPQHSPASWKQHDLASVTWIEQAKGGRWIPHPIEKHRCYHPTVDLGDHDGDGKLDIAVGNYVWITGPQGRTHSPADYVTVFRAR